MSHAQSREGSDGSRFRPGKAGAANAEPGPPGIPERQTHDYARHGVTSLLAALNTATGQVTDPCHPRHRHQEFLRFLKKAAAYPTEIMKCYRRRQ